MVRHLVPDGPGPAIAELPPRSVDIEFVLKAVVGTASPLLGVITSLGDEFRFTSDGGAITVTLARHYSEVKQGRGVAFVTPNGFVQVQINGGRASDKLKVEKGGALRIEKVR
jgi:hypothetical protein